MCICKKNIHQVFTLVKTFPEFKTISRLKTGTSHYTSIPTMSSLAETRWQDQKVVKKDGQWTVDGYAVHIATNFS